MLPIIHLPYRYKESFYQETGIYCMQITHLTFWLNYDKQVE